MSQNVLPQIHELLASKGYAVSDAGPGSLRIQDTDSHLSITAVLEGEIVFFSMNCATVPAAALTPAVLRKMLDANNGISTSHFQVFEAGTSAVISLNNFCKLQRQNNCRHKPIGRPHGRAIPKQSIFFASGATSNTSSP